MKDLYGREFRLNPVTIAVRVGLNDWRRKAFIKRLWSKFSWNHSWVQL